MEPLLATVVWPLAAVLLVACGATLATSGRPSATSSERSGGRSDDVAPAGGRPDGRGGDRLMVVIAPDDGGRTVLSAIEAARRSGAEITLVGDAHTVAQTYDKLGSLHGAATGGTGFGRV